MSPRLPEPVTAGIHRARRLAVDRLRRPGDGPTPADVRAAYRVVLGREPDPSGLATYGADASAGRLSFERLASELLGSPEFALRQRRQPHDSVEVVDVDGFAIAVDPTDWAVGATIAAVRRYEPEVTAALRRALSPGASMIDVGANIGWFALVAAAAVGAGGRVLAVEPNPRNCRLLERSCAHNGFDTVRVVCGAVSDTEGWLALETDASNGRVIPLGSPGPDAATVTCSYAVPSFRLDDLADDGPVDALKVDVEGFETQVFAGAGSVLADRRPVVLFEWYPEALERTGGVDPAAPLGALRAHGYRIGVVGDPAGAGSDLDDASLEARRRAAGQDLLDLVAHPPA